MQGPVIEVLSGKGYCPPDDCGGTYGYRDFAPLAFDLYKCRLRVDDYQRLIEEVRRGLFRR